MVQILRDRSVSIDPQISAQRIITGQAGKKQTPDIHCSVGYCAFCFVCFTFIGYKLILYSELLVCYHVANFFSNHLHVEVESLDWNHR